MKYAHILKNTVIGLYNYSSEVDSADLVMLVSEDVNIGDNYHEGTFSKKVIDEPVNVEVIHIVVTRCEIDAIEQENFHHIKLHAGSNSRFILEFRDDEGHIIKDDVDFEVPLIGLYGQKGRSFMGKSIEGIVNLNIDWPESGEWQFNQDSINRYVDHKSRQYVFSGLAISVFE